MELIGKISNGSKMDQIYIPKQRANFKVGSYVLIQPLEKVEGKIKEKPCFYNVSRLEPIKLIIIERIFGVLENFVKDYDNIIVTGSFLDKGFNFNDIDIVLISSNKVDINYVQLELEKDIGIKFHILLLNNKVFIKGLCTDPLYQLMLSKCIAKNKFIYNIRHKINYKLLDLHLLKSKLLISNFDILSGNEKYYLIRNMLSIYLFIDKKKISKNSVDKEINKVFGLKVKKIKENILEKDKFLKKYKIIYNQIFNRIMQGIKNGSKQK